MTFPKFFHSLSLLPGSNRVPPVAATAHVTNHLKGAACVREVGKCARKGCDAPRLLGRVYCGDHGVTMSDTLDNIRVIPPLAPVDSVTLAGVLVRKAGGGGSMDVLRRFLDLETDRHFMKISKPRA
jgi:hypothetical protein